MVISTINKNLFFFSFNNSLLKEEYFNILLFFSIASLLALIIIALSYTLTNQNPETEKFSSYECGFEPYDNTKNKFDVKFCIIAILFILFDIEIIFLLPWSISISHLNTISFWSMIDFLLELSLGFVYIWKIGGLRW